MCIRDRVMEASIGGVSTRKVDALVSALDSQSDIPTLQALGA